MCLYRTMSWALCSVPMICVLAPVPHCPAHYGFMRVLRLGRISLPTLFSFSSVLVVPGFVPLYMGVRSNLSITKKLSRVFIKIAFNLQIMLGRANTLKMLSLPVHELLRYKTRKMCKIFMKKNPTKLQ